MTFQKKNVFCLFALNICLILFIVSEVVGSKTQSPNSLTKSVGEAAEKDGVCASIDVRNKVKNLELLENCTVIEGQLHILLIDQATHLDYEKYSFPKLVEITDHLLLYRVYGLRTLRNLFPNLSVIRGQNLFNNYALIAYEMQDLETLGLIGLTTIMRGAVRLQKNTKLCYIDTIDWSKIATSVDVQYHYFEENKDEQECVNVCPEGCPENRCWTSEFCQKNLKCPCTSRYGAGFCNDATGACCHEYCVGGCTGPEMNQCISCRNVTYNGHCQPACPAETYMFMNRRCLLDRECINISRKAVADHWKIIRHENTNAASPGLCVEECPNGYSVDEKDPTSCKKCEDYCPKECLGKTVDSIESAQKLKGCTKIKGPLEIQIMGGSNIGQELEASLGQIQEVTEYIKIVRSYALLSLGFFKNLRVIHGDKKQYGNYSLLIMDNANLQELFPKEVSSNISIKAGDVAFHFNRKLCYHKITEFLTKIKVKYTDNDVSPLTNGDQIPCSVKKMDLDVRVGPNFAILRWQRFEQADSRQLLSYVINYREAKSKDVNIYQGRDACMDTTWKTYDANPDDYKDPNNIVELVFGLKPWTQYAAYIQTYSLATANEAANSELMFFTTHPSKPTTPTDLEVYSEEQGELRVRWNPPKRPNGNVTHYYVYWQLQELETEAFDKRDYCDNPILMPKKRKVKIHDEKTKYINQTMTKDGQCCQCPKSKRTLEEQQRQRQQQIEFENDLHDRIYTKRPELSNRKKRDNTPDDEPMERDPITPNVPDKKEAKKVTLDKKKVAGDSKNVTRADNSQSADERNNSTADNNSDNSTRPVFNQITVYGTEIVIPNLGHFQEYNIQVLACQETDPATGIKYCSSRAIATARTLPSTTSDNVNASTVKIVKSTNKTQDILVTWKSPENPNGVIITFQIEYKKISTADVEPTRICFTHKEYRKLGGYKFQRLNPGNYSFRIKATSLAGNGSFTQPFFFVVPELDVRTTNEAVIAAAVIGVLLVIIITIIIVWFVAKSKFAKDPDVTTISMNPGYVPSADVYIADDWEMSRDKIKLIRELGQGSFGMVYEGVGKDIGGSSDEVKVAVKTVNDSAGWHERMMFLKEASTMKSFSCHHVVRLLGVVSKGQPALVIMELMGQGDLKNFLRLHRPDEEENMGRLPPTLKQILQMAGEIADGMAYLADKKFVHRDLAARNCMVADDRTVKIGDFGMTRDIYETDYYRKGGKGLLPVRWMAPESLKDGIFTTMSDVWSYGVVLWEMATLAAQPYQGLSNEEVLKYVSDGRYMEKPDGCPEKIYDLMCQCWRYRYKKRPTFKEIIELLVPDLDPNFKDVSYFFSDENKVDATEYKNLQATEDQEDYGNVEFNEQSDDEMDINDESRIPFMSAVETSNLNSVEMQRSPSRHHHRDSSNTSPCECVLLEEMPNGHRNSTCSSPNSGVGYSDGSKGSSKSSNSSYTQLNGIANGHIHMRLPRTTPC
ncbi:putative molluscan insulin-related peptide(s) receptor [Haliotis rubra]|uniref:putative molluscan insulin-related peptide(s) receptor n=1 Tax=Haliotis rubra TaxID=36100 RepID=UPI001EE5F40A|nr:putative molluscan insulin-related peptide(s) receptor [Haliotis rubra]